MKIADRLLPPAGLRVLISGGAAGIGRVIAQGFHEVGAQVFVCDIDESALAKIRQELPGVEGIRADVSQATEVDQVVEQAVTRLGGLDVLINNAGIAGPTGAVESLTEQAWEQTVSTNLNSQFYFLRKAVPHLKQSRQNPHVVVMSSVAGRLAYPFRTPYAATKWAVIGLMKSLANELGPDNVRVNAILPGVVEGERMSRVIAARADALGITTEQMQAQYVEKISLRRMVTAEDVAASVLYLSSPAAVNVTGQAISVDANVEYL